MIYSYGSDENAEKIVPINMVKFLQDLNWREISIKRNDLRVFQFDRDNKFYQVTIPMDKKLSDFSAAMLRAVETVAESMQTSTERMILTLMNPMSDILKVRVMNSSVKHGSISIEDALKLFESIKMLFTWTAMDVLQPRLYHQGRQLKEVQEMVKKCRWGQTEAGSYIISLVCPLVGENEGEDTQLTLFDDKTKCTDSLTRRTTVKLLKSIDQVKRSIDSLDRLFSDSNTGISLNFLIALSSLDISKEGCETEISADWASTVMDTSLGFNAVSISHDYYEPIQAQIRRMRPSEKIIKKYN